VAVHGGNVATPERGDVATLVVTGDVVDGDGVDVWWLGGGHWWGPSDSVVNLSLAEVMASGYVMDGGGGGDSHGLSGQPGPLSGDDVATEGGGGHHRWW
jgi:hypothetical protein